MPDNPTGGGAYLQTSVMAANMRDYVEVVFKNAENLVQSWHIDGYAFWVVYHSSFADDDGITKACSCPLLPLKTHIKGPAPASDPDKADIVDEAITFFRANVFFKNFHVKCSADKLLIYLTFYINIALKRLEGCRTLAVGTKAIINLGLEKVPVPGEPGFPFPGLFTLPQSQEEAELLRNYLKQIREETSGRLLNCAYRANGFPNKWWLAFAKRKFMNIVIL
ncbi:Actin-related protein 2/3 complex subunit 3 [Zea mays]|uniref:Actin-related protein 2/3 complex subunit 3 n=1 Tax=Zea mays TaxID=4577 RepID=A0A1D6H695_MAIZE|nr:Actin-related protein 2/3 complex subunit 3 [Zea mays]